MATFHSPAHDSSQQGMTMIPVEHLVPVDTQLITPSLAEAFELNHILAGPDLGKDYHARDTQGKDDPAKEIPKDVSGNKDHAQGIPSLPQNTIKQQPADFQYQGNLYGNAQQSLLGNFFPQPSPANLAAPQTAFHMEPQDHQLQGFLRQQATLSGPQMPPGYPGMSPQFNQWMDPAAPGPFQPTSNPAKHSQEGNVGSDPDNDDYQARALKRPRLVWTLQLHQRFVDAVEQLGLKNAVPKTIMQLMNVDGLTRENVASHLQKYRLQLKKDGGKGVDMAKMVDEEPPKDSDQEPPRLTTSEGLK